MLLYHSLLAAFLFFVLVPGNFIRLPPKGTLMTAVLVHGVVFFLIFFLVNWFMRGQMTEGFQHRKQHKHRKQSICGKFSMYKNKNRQWYTRHGDKCNVQKCKKSSGLKYHQKKGIWTFNGSPCYVPLPMRNKHK